MLAFLFGPVVFAATCRPLGASYTVDTLEDGALRVSIMRLAVGQPRRERERPVVIRDDSGEVWATVTLYDYPAPAILGLRRWWLSERLTELPPVPYTVEIDGRCKARVGALGSVSKVD